MQSTRGLFIVVEGIDASGSTTQASRLSAYLRERGSRVVQTHEPSDGPAGMLIRLALNRRISAPAWAPGDGEPAYAALDPLALALLFAADRRDHVATRVEPALAHGIHVVSDRYALSSLAYQGLHADAEWILEINKHAPVPDLTVFLDLPARQADDRIRTSRMQRDAFEQLGFQEQVEKKYREAIAGGHSSLGRVEVVDASRPVDDVWRDIQSLADTLLAERPAA